MAIDTRPEEQSDQAISEARRMAKERSDKRRQWYRTIGKYLITLGLLTIGFVVYEYWGTGYLTQRAQNSLRAGVATHGLVHYSVPDQFGVIKQERRPIRGKALGYIKIPRLNLDMIFVQGGADPLTEVGPLKLGPAHYVRTPMPGQGGNVAIAGHRTTYLHPFWGLNDMRKGDLITLETSAGIFVYRVIWSKVTVPTDVSVLAPTAKPSLTLTTCNPRFSARQRLDVRAVQISGPGLTAPAPALIG
jgi:sortase A